MGLRSSLSVICLTASLVGCAHTDEWTSEDTRRELIFQAVNAMDAYTTTRIQHTDGIEEKFPITRAVLGSQPETSDTIVYFTTLGISHWLISRSLPAKWRPYWQNGTTAIGTAVVISNCDKDLC